ncbi:MAG: SufE family protein, partial [Myxococcota bacterium]
CQSQVWMHARLNDGTVEFQADSDAMIVRGLIAILVEVYSGESPDAILETPPSFIDDLGLSSHLSQNRANGLSAMIKQMKMYAAAFKALAARGA